MISTVEWRWQEQIHGIKSEEKDENITTSKTTNGAKITTTISNKSIISFILTIFDWII